MTEYKVGDVVEWSSQAQGSWKTKRGKVTRVSRGYPFRGAKKQTQCVTVTVPPPPMKNGQPSTAKPTIYQPRLSALKLVQEVA